MMAMSNTRHIGISCLCEKCQTQDILVSVVCVLSNTRHWYEWSVCSHTQDYIGMSGLCDKCQTQDILVSVVCVL